MSLHRAIKKRKGLDWKLLNEEVQTRIDHARLLRARDAYIRYYSDALFSGHLGAELHKLTRAQLLALEHLLAS